MTRTRTALECVMFSVCVALFVSLSVQTSLFSVTEHCHFLFKYEYSNKNSQIPTVFVEIDTVNISKERKPKTK